MAIFPNRSLLRVRSLCSKLSGIDPKNLHLATLRRGLKEDQTKQRRNVVTKTARRGGERGKGSIALGRVVQSWDKIAQG